MMIASWERETVDITLISFFLLFLYKIYRAHWGNNWVPRFVWISLVEDGNHLNLLSHPHIRPQCVSVRQYYLPIKLLSLPWDYANNSFFLVLLSLDWMLTDLRLFEHVAQWRMPDSKYHAIGASHLALEVYFGWCIHIGWIIIGLIG